MTDHKAELVRKLARATGVADEAMLDVYVRTQAAFVKEFGTKSVDSGVGLGGMDFWVTLDGVEYTVTLKKKAQ